MAEMAPERETSLPCPEGKGVPGSREPNPCEPADLRPEDFRSFFHEVVGSPPYPWQERLLEQVVQGDWPDVVAVPTGAGKTMAILVAVFRMALCPRSAHRRVVYVVNRRLVVDQAYELALGLQAKLKEAQCNGDTVLGRVARRLAILGDGEPLEVVRLRGGVPKPTPTLSDPARPAVILATVDLAGSRLLHRGYGVSRSLYPVEAALFGVDALYLLDEAHLERPFWETLRSCAQAGDAPVRPGLKAVALTATPQSLGQNLSRFTLDQSDQAHPGLNRRLQAPKRLQLLEVDHKQLEKELVGKALELYRKKEGPVAVVCNQVVRALEVYRRLKEELGGGVLLLTGRMRPYERDQFFARTQALQKRMDEGEVKVVVATQALEVGADLDFWGLVTEMADLSALLQRMGRVNRRGQYESSEVVLLALGPGEYGGRNRHRAFPYDPESLEATREWWSGVLNGGVGEVSPERLSQLLSDSPPKQEAFGQGREPLPLHRALHLALAQTDPPVPIDPDPFLHGVGGGVAEVEVVWRADLPLTADEAVVQGYVEAAPPQPRESVRVPLHAFRAWLSGRVQDFADVEGRAPAEEKETASPETRKLAFVRWDGEEARVVRLTGKESELGVRPGDTVLVPAEWGGLSEGHWDPKSTEPVRDVAEPAQEHPYFLRLHEASLASLLGPDQARAFLEDLRARLQDEAISRSKATEAIRELLEAWQGRDSKWDDLQKAVPQGAFGVWPWPPDWGKYPGLILRLRPRVPLYGLGGPESLEEHTLKVAHTLEEFLQRLCLGEESQRAQEALSSAALWHDLGKLDPRMQQWMWLSASDLSGVELPLGKSGSRLGLGELRQLQQEAGYPIGQRHEFVVAGALLSPGKALEAHLVATHHGRGRPLPGACPDNEPVTIEIDQALAGTLAWPGPNSLNSQYQLHTLGSGYLKNFCDQLLEHGPWALAYLEALLRLADFKASGG